MTRPQPAALQRACPGCRGTGDTFRPGSQLTYRMCPACGGTGHSPEQERGWSEPADRAIAVVEHGPPPYVRRRDDALANHAPADGWTGGPAERWFHIAEPDDTAPSPWPDVPDSPTRVASIRPVGDTQHQPGAAVVPLHVAARTRSAASPRRPARLKQGREVTATEDRTRSTAGYNLDLAARVAALTRVDPAAVAAVYTAGEAASRRDAAAYWATALAPLEAAVRHVITTSHFPAYAELARRRGETWDPAAGRWRALPRPGDRTPAPQVQP